ncbi:YaaR family protein [Salibacterium aidingense]|uniref:YaaR family protein n=1 Tax=Salibacterium aidingense TaxID=384933 RepID=UPI00040BC170|nr:YaaR family protein [Salibacterium aidingense]
MDIQKVMQTGTTPPAQKSKEAPRPGVTFSEIMEQRRSDKAYDRFTKIIQDIDDLGKVLSESRTVEELRKYKQLVKDFMEEAVEHGLNLEEKRGFNRRGRTKVYKIVEEVDQKLLDLTNSVVDQQKSSLDILDQVGEIRGLLVNIYA